MRTLTFLLLLGLSLLIACAPTLGGGGGGDDDDTADDDDTTDDDDTADDDDDDTTDDDDTGVGEVEVVDSWADCGPEPEPMPEDNLLVSAGEGTLTVTHFNWSEGCCPEIEVRAVVYPDDQLIEVSFELFNDFCDCICMLDVSYTLAGIPGGIYEVDVAGGPLFEVEID